MVKLVNYRDLRNAPSKVWAALEENEAVAIVVDGAPRALMLGIENGDIEAALQLVRRVRVQMALSRLRTGAARRGVDRLSDEELDAEIRAARVARRVPASTGSD